jgi:hypothetical protein
MACKPGSLLRLRGWMAIPLGRELPLASRDLPGRLSGNGLRAVPIWSCSRWGLPCHSCCQERGALLPHHFNLAAANLPVGGVAGRRCHFCGAVPGVTPGGCYPSPCFRGARTFLPPSPCGLRRAGPPELETTRAAIRPSDAGALYSGHDRFRNCNGSNVLNALCRRLTAPRPMTPSNARVFIASRDGSRK